MVDMVHSGLTASIPGVDASGGAAYLAKAAYHGTPITPNAVLQTLGFRDYCVSYYRPDQVEWIDANARSWFADNGIFSAWMKGTEFSEAYWQAYYDFCRRWCLDGRCSWAVIPDPIGTGTQELDYFIREWPSARAVARFAAMTRRAMKPQPRGRGSVRDWLTRILLARCRCTNTGPRTPAKRRAAILSLVKRRATTPIPPSLTSATVRLRRKPARFLPSTSSARRTTGTLWDAH